MAYGRFVFRVVIFVLALSTVGMIPAGFVTQRWLVTRIDQVVTIDGGVMVVGGTAEASYGLFQYCQFSAVSDTCTSYTFDAANAEFVLPSSCGRSQDDLKTRFRVVAAFSIIALIFAIVVAAFAAMVAYYLYAGTECPIQTGLKCVGLAVAATACQLISVAVYGATMSSWANCGNHYCDAAPQGFQPLIKPNFAVNDSVTYNCGYGFSFALAVVSCLTLLALLVLELIDFATFPKFSSRTAERESLVAQPVHESRPAATQFRDVSVTHPVERTVAVDEQPVIVEHRIDSGDDETMQRGSTEIKSSAASYASHSILLPEGDDWEYDAVEKLYWSPSQQLFFDNSSGHFFDPVSGSWYNPTLQVWYQL